jgi:hypothetical protein
VVLNINKVNDYGIQYLEAIICFLTLLLIVLKIVFAYKINKSKHVIANFKEENFASLLAKCEAKIKEFDKSTKVQNKQKIVMLEEYKKNIEKMMREKIAKETILTEIIIFNELNITKFNMLLNYLTFKDFLHLCDKLQKE